MKKKVHLLPVALAFLIGLGTVGCGNRQKTAGTAPETVTSGVSEEESTKQETESQTAEEVPAYPVGSWTMIIFFRMHRLISIRRRSFHPSPGKNSALPGMRSTQGTDACLRVTI